MSEALLVIGSTGVGKSTIVNMLFHGDSSDEACADGPAQVGGTAASVTKGSQMYVNINDTKMIFDTVGLGDRDLTDVEIVSQIRSVLRVAGFGIKAVIVIMKMERVSQESQGNLELLQGLFTRMDLRNNGILVLTHWNGNLGEEAEDLKKWVCGDPAVGNLVECFADVILTNNATRCRVAYPEARKQCLDKLQHFIAEDRPLIFPRRGLVFFDLIASLLSYFYQKIRRSKPLMDLKLLASQVMSSRLTCCCGTCSICHEQIDLVDVCILPCHHPFHFACIEPWHIRGMSSCPVCRRVFRASDIVKIAQSPRP